MKVRYIGDYDLSRAIDRDREYTVQSVEKGWYRIITELDGEDYLFPPELFEITDKGPPYPPVADKPPYPVIKT